MKKIPLPTSFKNITEFIKLFFKLFNDNQITVAAGNLTFNTMLALVPLIMVIFSIFSAFPVFKEFESEISSIIFNNLSLEAGDIIQEYIRQFIDNTKKMSAIGTVSLVIVALMLMHAIDTSLNRIWKNSNKRKLVSSIAIYWTILTMGPILVALATAVSSYVLKANLFNGHATSLSIYLLSLIPFVITWLVFTLIYAIVPNTNVPIRYAMAGAVIAAIFFTLGKKAFSLYLVIFPSYQIIYGAIAVVPILIFWIYLSWTFILIGAQLTATFTEYGLLNTLISQGEPQNDSSDSTSHTSKR